MYMTTLCYLERQEQYLMLHRVSKKNDVNKDKWIGIGGKFEKGESPEDCLLREVKEETGYTLTGWRYRGIVTFLFNDEDAEYMSLYTSDSFEGEEIPCDEGTLEWVDKSAVDSLNLWEGDRIFFDLLKQDAPFFSLKLHYRGDRLEEAVLDGKAMELLDVLDENGEPSGLVRERAMVHRRGDYHRTSHVWIARNGNNGGHELLLQKRSMDKDSFPGSYDISSAGHIPAGMDYLESARRELFEELGVSVEPEQLRLIGFHEGRYHGEFYGRPFINHEKNAIYVCLRPVKEEELRLQASEVDSVRWMDAKEILLRARREEPGFCLYPEELEMVIEYLNR